MKNKEVIGSILVTAVVFGALGGVMGFVHGTDVAQKQSELRMQLLMAEQSTRFAQKVVKDAIWARRMAESQAMAAINMIDQLSEEGVKPRRYVALEPLIRRLESVFAGNEFGMLSVERLRRVHKHWYEEAI